MHFTFGGNLTLWIVRNFGVIYLIIALIATEKFFGENCRTFGAADMRGIPVPGLHPGLPH